MEACIFHCRLLRTMTCSIEYLLKKLPIYISLFFTWLNFLDTYAYSGKCILFKHFITYSQAINYPSPALLSFQGNVTYKKLEEWHRICLSLIFRICMPMLISHFIFLLRVITRHISQTTF